MSMRFPVFPSFDSGSTADGGKIAQEIRRKKKKKVLKKLFSISFWSVVLRGHPPNRVPLHCRRVCSSLLGVPSSPLLRRGRGRERVPAWIGVTGVGLAESWLLSGCPRRFRPGRGRGVNENGVEVSSRGRSDRQQSPLAPLASLCAGRPVLSSPPFPSSASLSA